MQDPPCTPAETHLLRKLGEKVSPDTSWQCTTQTDKIKKNIIDTDFVAGKTEQRVGGTKRNISICSG